jgi:hypothetical protein
MNTRIYPMRGHGIDVDVTADLDSIEETVQRGWLEATVAQTGLTVIVNPMRIAAFAGWGDDEPQQDPPYSPVRGTQIIFDGRIMEIGCSVQSAWSAIDEAEVWVSFPRTVPGGLLIQRELIFGVIEYDPVRSEEARRQAEAAAALILPPR